ncbi:MAG: inositol monophosphatase family protein [Pseudomonadota bacterium]
MRDTLKKVCDIAKRAGQVQIEHFGNVRHVAYKGAIDLVTEVDKECETLIVEELQKAFPKDDILAEEGSGKRHDSRRRWIVDPLDGTVNFTHGFPFFCTSIALEVNGQLDLGVIYDPNRDEMFSAARGSGARLNERSISVSKVPELGHALLATGFAYNVREESRLDNLDNFSRFIKRARAIRRPGSAAIDLAWIACGRIDGFWELFLKSWDMAAGVCIIREAGGMVSSFDGSPYNVYGTQILASNGLIHNEMMHVLSMGNKK